MNSENHESRISRLEQRFDDHEINSLTRFDRNDADHGRIIEKLQTFDEKLDTVEKYILRWESYVIGAGFVVGGIVGFVVSKWDWLINKLGHQ